MHLFEYCSQSLRFEVGASSYSVPRRNNIPGTCGRASTKKKKPPIYRVMLHNDTFNRREYVVSVILKVVDGYTVDEAVNVMQVLAASTAGCPLLIGLHRSSHVAH